MDLNLQPLAAACFVTGDPFQEGDRVVSRLVRNANLEIMRYDVAESRLHDLAVEGALVCSWVQAFEPRLKEENPDRALKLTAENLFVTLADPANEPDAETVRLIQFLALMLERKRLLRAKGRSGDGTRNVFEHAKTKQLFEVPAGDFDPAFFVAVQAQLSVLVGGPTTPTEEPVEAAVPAEGPLENRH